MKNIYAIVAIAVIIILGGIFFFSGDDQDVQASEEMNIFAQCLADSGATFYGAFWCPNCQDQKELLENSNSIPYVECSTPDGQSQLSKCREKNIKAYPTWEFSDGSREIGSIPLQALSEKTECALPVISPEISEETL